MKEVPYGLQRETTGNTVLARITAVDTRVLAQMYS